MDTSTVQFTPLKLRMQGNYIIVFLSVFNKFEVLIKLLKVTTLWKLKTPCLWKLLKFRMTTQTVFSGLKEKLTFQKLQNKQNFLPKS